MQRIHSVEGGEGEDGGEGGKARWRRRRTGIKGGEEEGGRVGEEG